MDDPYSVLGVQPDADEWVIKAVYQALVKEHHPDSGGDPEEFKRIQKAYEAIQDPTQGADTYSDDAYYSNLGEELFGGIGTPVSTASAIGARSANLVIDDGPLTITLVGLFHTDIADLAWEHEVDNIDTEDRFVAIFHIENTSEYVQPWKGSNDTKFIGTDGHGYDVRQLHLAAQHHTPLPPQFDTNFTDLEPKTSTFGVLVPAETPKGVDIERIVYKHKAFEGDQTDGWVKEAIRYEFQLEPEDRLTMRKFIAGELVAPETEESDTNSDDSTPRPPDEASPDSRNDAQRESRNPEHELGEQDLERLADVVALQPTTNGELRDAWGLKDGKSVHRYLTSTLEAYVFRREDKRICATDEAELLVEP